MAGKLLTYLHWLRPWQRPGSRFTC